MGGEIASRAPTGGSGGAVGLVARRRAPVPLEVSAQGVVGLPALVSDGEAELWAAAWGRPPGEVATGGGQRRRQDRLSVRGPVKSGRTVGRAGAHRSCCRPSAGRRKAGSGVAVVAQRPSRWAHPRHRGRRRLGQAATLCSRSLCSAGGAQQLGRPRRRAQRLGRPRGGASVRLSINRIEDARRRRMWPKGTAAVCVLVAGPGRGVGWCRASEPAGHRPADPEGPSGPGRPTASSATRTPTVIAAPMSSR